MLPTAAEVVLFTRPCYHLQVVAGPLIYLSGKSMKQVLLGRQQPTQEDDAAWGSLPQMLA